MAQPFLCHGHGGPFQYRRGADLHCSKACEEQYRAAQKLMETSLTDGSFIRAEGTSNLWVKDGVHISIEQVMREGLAETLAKHRAVVRERS